MFYCPNCKTLETKDISYTEREYIFTNCRDGYGSFIHNVICKTCNYPLAGIVYVRNKIDEGDIDYYKSVMTAYQNGEFAEKNDMLQAIEDRYQERVDSALKIVNFCKQFKEKGEPT
jgi:hypothetical protein